MLYIQRSFTLFSKQSSLFKACVSKMAKIAFILLCHKDPDAVIAQASRLTAAGDCIAIHFDARAKPEYFQKVQAALSDNPNVTFAKKRVKCGWGEWSLVQATLNALEAAIDRFPRATHFYMLSGDCMPIKSASYVHKFLDDTDADYIESHDFFESDWIKTGWKEDRLIYRHYFNERTQKKRFYGAFYLQKKLGLTRDVPPDLQIMIGSQWWCLRRRTIEAVLKFTKQRKDIVRFFQTTWIPDETFFQTLVRHMIPQTEIRSRTLTFLLFSDYGMPVTFYNDHYDLLLNQDFLFARKISPEAFKLKRRLGKLYASQDVDFQISAEGGNLYTFLTGRGRIGRRFTQRFWETESTLGRERELLIVTCKKWHVAKRLAAQIEKTTGLTTVEYLFDEDNTDLPNLGGIQSTLGKRTRHRRALMRMLFEYYKTERMLICLDPNNVGLIQDFYADRSKTKMLEIECAFSDEYLIGHAKRSGLAGERTTKETLENLLPTIRYDVAFESDRLRDAGFESHYRMREAVSTEENTATIAAFLDITQDKARNIAQTEHLFTD